MGLIACDINVSFQLTWQQHKGVMWLCQLQSLQVTQPLGRCMMVEKMWLCQLQNLQVTQPPDRVFMECGYVDCKICKWHSHFVDG